MKELAVCIAAALLIAVVVAVLMSRRRIGHQYHPKDPTQVRGIHQGLVMWAQNNQDRYPLPSLLDVNDDTVAAPAATKDTTSSIMSLLIYNGFFGPEICVSPNESNSSIKQFTMYAYSNPSTAVRPAKALWDPAFNADFTAKGGGHFSYAHALPTGPRLRHWKNNFAQDVAILGNRGPRVTAMSWAASGAGQPILTPGSNTLLIHGPQNSWEGSIVYADNHVNYETSMSPQTFTDTTGTPRADCLFFDEPEDPVGVNALLSIWTRSGATAGEWTSIWD